MVPAPRSDFGSGFRIQGEGVPAAKKGEEATSFYVFVVS